MGRRKKINTIIPKLTSMRERVRIYSRPQLARMKTTELRELFKKHHLPWPGSVTGSDVRNLAIAKLLLLKEVKKCSLNTDQKVPALSPTPKNIQAVGE